MSLLEAREVGKRYGPVVALGRRTFRSTRGKCTRSSARTAPARARSSRSSRVSSNATAAASTARQAGPRLVAVAGGPHRAGARVPGSGARTRPDGRTEHPPDRVGGRGGQATAAHDGHRDRLHRAGGRCAAAAPADDRSRPSDGARSAALAARRDHGGIAFRSRRAGVRGDGGLARSWSVGPLHHAPAGRGDRHV